MARGTHSTTARPRQGGISRRGPGRLAGVSGRHVGQLLVQLSDLLEAGCPLTRALEAVMRHGGDSPTARLAGALHEEISNGASLASAMQALPGHFSEAQVSMVRASEAGGFLQATLDRLASHVLQQGAMLRQVRSKLAYPVVLFVTAAASVIFLLAYVVPRFTRMYEAADQTLPTATRVLLSVSGTLERQWLFVLVGLVVLVVGGAALFRWEPFGQRWDRLVLRVPMVGGLIRNWELATFARTIGLLLRGGATVLTSLRLSGQVVRNRALRAEVEQLAVSVERGEPLSGRMRGSRFFDATTTEMIVVSESTGRLSTVMDRLAEQRSRDFQLRIDALMSLLEPAIILIIGVLVGLTVMALLLPVFLMNTLVVG